MKATTRNLARISGLVLMAALGIALAGSLGTLATATQASAQTPDASAAEIAFWNSVKDSRNADELEAYLQAFPNGTFAPLARVRIADIRRGGSAAPGPSAPAGTGFDRSNREQVRELQNKLYNLNYNVRVFDGIYGSAVSQAVSAWQKNLRLEETGDITPEQFARIRNAVVPVTWGAMAYSVRGASGTAWNRPTRRQAEDDALAECRKRVGNATGQAAVCNIIAAANRACGALGHYRTQIGSQIYNGAYAVVRPNVAAATTEALTQCNAAPNSRGNCGVRITFCADGSHRGT